MKFKKNKRFLRGEIRGSDALKNWAETLSQLVVYTHQTAPSDIPGNCKLPSPCSANLQFHTPKLIKICLSRTKIIYFIASVINVTFCRYQHNSTATRYGLDEPGIESRWVAIFSAHVQTGPEAHATSFTMGTGSFLGISGRGVVFNTHSNLAPRLKKV